MSNEERYKKYIQEHCKNCKNRKSNLCDIRITINLDIVETRCNYYLKEQKEQVEVDGEI